MQEFEYIQKKLRVTSQPPLTHLTKTLTMKKFTFFSRDKDIGLRNIFQIFCELFLREV